MDGIKLIGGIISTLKVNKSAMEKALIPEMLATDIAYFLVRKGFVSKSRLYTPSSFFLTHLKDC